MAKEWAQDHFNPAPPSVMHIDLNSCFATIEQQANPFYRGKPIAVAAYTTPSGCVVAPSIEAKRVGCKVGMTMCGIKGLNLSPPSIASSRTVILQNSNIKATRYCDVVDLRNSLETG